MPTHTLDTLYRQRKDGKWQVCKMSVTQKDAEDPATITTVHGIEDGKQQTDTKVVSSGKNIGKSNETTIWEQALSDAQSKWNKKKDSGYNTSKIKLKDDKFLPMLAYEYEKRVSSVFRQMKKDDKKKATVIIQPKLDGVRASVYLVDGKPQMFSRKGKNISVVAPHILKHFEKMPDTLVVDGELYSLEGNIQAIAGAANKKTYDPERHSQLCFVIFDAYWKNKPDLSFLERFTKDAKVSKDETVFPVDKFEFSWALCKPFQISTKEELDKIVLEKHREATDCGFEGVMVRFDHYPYMKQKRTVGLLKFKQFFDEEYTIVDITTPKSGRTAGTAIYVCKTEDDVQFNCDSTGTLQQRRELYDNREKLIGEQLTVQYQDLTDDGVPRFPKGIAVRNYE